MTQRSVERSIKEWYRLKEKEQKDEKRSFDLKQRKLHINQLELDFNVAKGELSYTKTKTKTEIISEEIVVTGVEEPQVSKPKVSKYLNSLKYIIPKASREEFLADVYEMNLDMNSQGLSKFWIFIMNGLHFASVFIHAYKFKLTGYFYAPIKEKQRS